MALSSYSTTGGLSRASFIKSFYIDEFVFAQNYIKYLSFQTQILKAQATEIRSELSKLPNIDELTTWKYIHFVATAQKIFDELAVICVNASTKNLKGMSKRIYSDGSSPSFFYRRNGKKQNIKLWDRKKVISKALGIYNASQSSQFKALTKSDQEIVKAIMRESLEWTHVFIQAIEKVEKLHAELRNKYVHSPGHIWADLTVTDKSASKLIAISRTSEGHKHNRKSVPLSVDMFEVVCGAVDQATALSISVISHLSFRIRTFDKVEIPTNLPCITQEQFKEFDRIGQQALKDVRLADIKMKAEVTMKKKKDSFFDDPKAVWNKPFEKVVKKYPRNM